MCDEQHVGITTFVVVYSTRLLNVFCGWSRHRLRVYLYKCGVNRKSGRSLFLFVVKSYEYFMCKFTELICAYPLHMELREGYDWYFIIRWFRPKLLTPQNFLQESEYFKRNYLNKNQQRLCEQIHELLKKHFFSPYCNKKSFQSKNTSPFLYYAQKRMLYFSKTLSDSQKPEYIHIHHSRERVYKKKRTARERERVLSLSRFSP